MDNDVVEGHDWIDNAAVLFHVSIFLHFLLQQDPKLALFKFHGGASGGQLPRASTSAGARRAVASAASDAKNVLPANRREHRLSSAMAPTTVQSGGVRVAVEGCVSNCPRQSKPPRLQD